ncbi:LysR family transcriptional regulator [uncultured Thalassospira sp.]|uniref:LysR family transcriptional regulator n=1 Tax=uncultured Thalassospira sp. TaxID=404382 RepID=UPI0030DCD2F6|tara:strand:+ start:1601 stop:2482 length:882 start_codon:yes stop_codon:yes gene_type:complete
MNITQIRSLIAIAETGSFTAAAHRMGITQSAMSQAMAGLEENLAVKLLVRQSGGVCLTAFGERVLDHARRAMTHLNAIQTEAAIEAGQPPMSLRLAAFASVYSTILPRLIARFRGLHPDITLTLLESDDSEIENLLAAGHVDLGVVLNPAPEDNALLLGQDEWMAIFPRSHHLARRQSVSLADLAGQPFVLATGGCQIHAQSLLADAGLTLSDIRIRVRDWSSAIALVGAGEGIGLVPESALQGQDRMIGQKSLATARLDPGLYRQFGLRAPLPDEMSHAARLFWNMAERRIA